MFVPYISIEYCPIILSLMYSFYLTVFCLFENVRSSLNILQKLRKLLNILSIRLYETWVRGNCRWHINQNCDFNNLKNNWAGLNENLLGRIDIIMFFKICVLWHFQVPILFTCFPNFFSLIPIGQISIGNSKLLMEWWKLGWGVSQISLGRCEENNFKSHK